MARMWPAAFIAFSSLMNVLGAAPPSKSEPGTALLQGLAADSTRGVAEALRGQILVHLPDPLFEGSHNWGHTVQAVNGVKWKGKGVHVHAEKMKAPKNHGTWRKVELHAVNPNTSLRVDVREIRVLEAGRVAFRVFLSLDARAAVDQENWQSGVRLYSASARVRFRIHAVLDGEVAFRLEPGVALLPDAIVRFGVRGASVGYDNLVVEHLAGIGGEGARVLGEAIHRGLNRWHPSLERHLLERTEQAILKAGQAREVRVGLAELVGASGASKRK